ncbi:glycerol kinase [Vibrio sonorensis]|uniref:glycerol kinase n=1 Tax=Vibrio sonorensis TaxID=1004316 RepID=UPI0008DA6EB4|nr:glycerol kinase [Vibrio sonorensis]
MADKLSTTALAKLRDVEAKALFSDLKKAGYINRDEDTWVLTELGRRFGGDYAEHPKFGRFIVWPENLLIDTTATSGKTLSATALGQRYDLPAKKINQLLSELGWIARKEDGWHPTESGITMGAYQREDKESGQYFVVWHDSISRNKRLKQTIVEFRGQDASTQSTDKSYSHFRQKFEAKHRTLDGHYVRSTGELLIDNWLYMNGIVHAYDRQLPIEEDVISDFYLPQGRVYLQFWGSDTGAITEREREEIRQHYLQHEFRLIEITPEEINQLDDVLPPRLRAFGLKAY